MGDVFDPSAKTEPTWLQFQSFMGSPKRKPWVRPRRIRQGVVPKLSPECQAMLRWNREHGARLDRELTRLEAAVRSLDARVTGESF